MTVMFSTPDVFRSVSERFDRFCEMHSLTVLSRGTVRHWCWDWSGWKLEGMNRYLSILAAEEDGSRSKHSYVFEFWAEADDDARFVRRRALKKKVAPHDFSDEGFLSQLDNILSRTWRVAQAFTAQDLTKKYYSQIIRQGSLARAGRVEDEPRILVVEDRPEFQESIKQALRAANYRVIVEEAHSEAEALSMVASKKPDVVLLDIMMPKTSGIDLIRQLKERAGSEALPIIILTSEEVHPGHRTAFWAEYNDYVIKPIQPQELIVRLSQVLSKLRQ